MGTADDACVGDRLVGDHGRAVWSSFSEMGA